MPRELQKKIFGSSIVFAFALALLVATGYRTGAGENNSRQNDGKVAPSSDKREKGIVNNSNKWFADPKRGWIRSEEREEQKRRAAQQERSEHSTREKAGGTIWEY
jgi:hypothetical protein